MSAGRAEFDPDLASKTLVDVFCLGCSETYRSLEDYWDHDCPEPKSGEAYK